MKKLLVGLVMMLGAVSLAHGAGDAAAGQGKAAVCAGCHGADGNSVLANFPKLAGLGEKYLLKQLNDIKSGKRVIVEMTGLLDALSDQDLQDLAAYYNSQKISLGAAKADLVKKGEALYRGGNLATGLPACSGCHAPNGAGNGPAAFPRLSGQHAQYIEVQLNKFRAGERTNDGDGRMMQDIASKMSDTEIKALASYISGLR